MLNISSGIIKRPVKLVVYGAEGIGKSTLAAGAPDALFVDTEGGTAQLDISRINGIDTWDKLIAVPGEICKDPSVCKTLVIDTADWAEAMCITSVCERYKVSGIESIGYGKGYTFVAEEFAKFLSTLDKVIATGVNVIITAHGKLKKQELPNEEGAFDRWELKLSRQTAPLLKEWADALLFCNYKVYVVSSANDTKKAQGGKRVMYSTHHPCWDAKNRHGLPEEMDLNFANIAHLFYSGNAVPQEDLYSKLTTLMAESGVTDEQLRTVIAEKGHFTADIPVSRYPESFISRWVIPNWDKITGSIKLTGGQFNA